MCYKHKGTPSQQPQAGAGQAATGGGFKLFPNSYFERVASQQGCVQCQDRVAPEEVKTAIGVCTVFLLRKTVDWITSNKQQ